MEKTLCAVVIAFAILPSILFYAVNPEHAVLFARIFIAVCLGMLRLLGIDLT